MKARVACSLRLLTAHCSPLTFFRRRRPLVPRERAGGVGCGPKESRRRSRVFKIYDGAPPKPLKVHKSFIRQPSVFHSEDRGLFRFLGRRLFSVHAFSLFARHVRPPSEPREVLRDEERE